MGLFHKNPNESNFAGGSKNVMETIQNDAQGKDVLIKRDPREDFNTGSSVVVNPGEQAVFIKNGEIIGTLGGGTHQLTTENYPFLSRLRNMLTGGISSFPCRVYYVRTADSQIDWGTPNGIQYQDNWFKCPTIARGNGQYWVTFRSVPVFIERLMGNEHSYTIAELQAATSGMINSKIAEAISIRMEELTQEKEITAINGKVKTELQDMMCNDLQDFLDEYGLELKHFYIQTMLIEEDERRAAAISAGSQALAESRARVQQAQGKMAELHTMGDEYQRIKGMDLLQTLAENQGAGGIAGMGAGLGMGMAAGSAFSGLAQNVFASAPAQAQPQTPAGTVPASDPMESLKKMKAMLDAGLISQETYDAKVAEILSRL